MSIFSSLLRLNASLRKGVSAEVPICSLPRDSKSLIEFDIYDFMNEMDLACKQVRLRYWSTTARKHKYYRNKLQQDFKQPDPNCVWVSDITYIRVKDDFHYVCIVIDLFSRKVISHGISNNIDAELVKTTFRKAFKIRNKPKNLIFHSDQGMQYTSYKFRSYLRKHQVSQSFSNPGTPLDNAVAESFFACMKREELSHNLYGTAEQLEQDVSEFVGYFNCMRPHQKLGFRTPEQVEKDYYSDLKKLKRYDGYSQ